MTPGVQLMVVLAGFTPERLASLDICPVPDNDDRMCGVPLGSARIVGQTMYVHASYWPQLRASLGLATPTPPGERH